MPHAPRIGHDTHRVPLQAFPFTPLANHHHTMRTRHLALAAFSITAALAADDESNLTLLDTANPAIRELAEAAGDASTYDSLNDKNKIGVFYSEGEPLLDDDWRDEYSFNLLHQDKDKTPWSQAIFMPSSNSNMFSTNGHVLATDLGSSRQNLPMYQNLPTKLLDNTTAFPWEADKERLTWPASKAALGQFSGQIHDNSKPVRIYKRFEFPTQLDYAEDENDPELDRKKISPTARKFIIVVHGWNMSLMLDPYSDASLLNGTPLDGAWNHFFKAMNEEMAIRGPVADGWDIYAYRWGQDSYTGSANGNSGPLSVMSFTGFKVEAENTHGAGGVGAGVENGTQAAEIGYQHGLVLGRLIWEHCEYWNIPPEKIQFIAHSAGTWVARSASLFLNAKYGNLLKQQITLLDPYNPRAGYHEWIAMGSGFPTNVDNSDLRTDLINSWVGEVAPVDMWENIYSMDDMVSGTNSLYGGAFINQQVGQSSLGLDGGKDNFGAHGGPVRYYTFSVSPALKYEEPIVTPYYYNPPDDNIAWNKKTKEYLSNVGWEHSLFMQDYRANLPPLQQLLANASTFSVLRTVLPQPQGSSSGPQYAPAPESTSPWQQILVDVDSIGWVRAMLLPANGGAAELAGPVRPEPDGTFSIDLSDGTVLAGSFDTSVTPVAITLTIDGVPFGQKVTKAQGTNAQAGFDAQTNAAGNMVFSMVLADGTAGMTVARDAANTGWQGSGAGTVEANGAFTVTGADGLQVTGQLQAGGGLDSQNTIVTPPQVPEIHVLDAAGGSLASGVASKACGSVQLGGVSSALAITIKNTGTVALTELGVTVDGTHSGEFAVSALGTTSLAPDASVTLNVTFTPGAAGNRTARLRIASDDANENPFDIALTGTGFTATPMASGVTNGTLAAGAEDFYRVTVPGPGILIVWSEGDTNTHGTLLNSGGVVLDEDNDSDLQTNFRTSAVVAAGDYFIRVKGSIAATAGGYTLRSRFVSVQEPTQISFLERTGDGVNLGFTSTAGVSYGIQASEDLINWTTMDTVTGEGAEMLVPLPGLGGSPTAFLRVSYPIGQ